MDVLMRQLLMLDMIPRQPRKISTSELKSRLEEEGYQVSLRTIQRDLERFSGIGHFGIGSDDHKPAGWYWLPTAGCIEIPRMDPPTALTFKLVNSHLVRLLPPACLEHLG